MSDRHAPASTDSPHRSQNSHTRNEFQETEQYDQIASKLENATVVQIFHKEGA